MPNTLTPKSKPTMKLFGQDARVVLSVVALIAFFLVGITGVLIAQRQRQVRGPVSPTAPESKPAAAVTQVNTCSVALNIPFPSPTSVPTVIPSPSPSLAPSPTPTIIPSPSPRPSPSTVTYTCNSRCTTTAQCQTANTGYVCSGGYCRLGGNTASTICAYKCNSNCTTDTECKTANSDYMCYQGKCRMAANPTSTTCAYSCPTLTTGTPTTTCAPAANQNGTITWAWTPISGHNSTTQYQIQILNSANQVVGEDKGCKPGDEYYNCWQGTCKYTSYHLPGTYKARIKACTASCPSTTTLGFKVTTSKQIIVCK